MARLRFRISAAIRRWHARRNQPSLRFRMMNLQDYDDRPRGPGWFDSSWDLGQGLELEEVLPGEPGFLLWVEAMARETPAVKPAAGAGTIDFVVDHGAASVPSGLLVSAGADEVEPGLAAPDLDAIEWAPPEMKLELAPI